MGLAKAGPLHLELLGDPDAPGDVGEIFITSVIDLAEPSGGRWYQYSQRLAPSVARSASVCCMPRVCVLRGL